MRSWYDVQHPERCHRCLRIGFKFIESGAKQKAMQFEISYCTSNVNVSELLHASVEIYIQMAVSHVGNAFKAANLFGLAMA